MANIDGYRKINNVRLMALNADEQGEADSDPGITVTEVQVSVLDHRTILFTDGIHPASANAFLTALQEVNLNLRKLQSRGLINSPSVDLRITTEGGDVYSMFRIINAIRTNQFPVNTYSDGLVASAGVAIAASGVRRYAYRHTYFYLHNMINSMEGSYRHFMSGVSHMKELQAHYYHLISEYSSLSVEQVEEYCRDDLYFSANKAKEFGLVDEVL